MHPIRHRTASRRLVTAALAALLAGQGFIAPAQAAGPPGPPTNLTAAAGDDLVVLDWLAPADDGGSPITDYYVSFFIGGVLILFYAIGSTETSLVLTDEGDVYGFIDNGTTQLAFSVYAVNEFGYTESNRSNEVTIREGAPLPQVQIAAVPASGGSATTDAGGGPTLSDPVVTSVAVPATTDGGSLTIAETTRSEAPSGFVFLGQEIVIESTAATTVENPLRITFRVDPSFVPVTIFRDGTPITLPCDPAGTANPSPCVESGAESAEITILSEHASHWNVGFAAYAFQGFFSPVDNKPVANGTKAGAAIPIRFGLGGNQGLNVLATGYPRSQRVTCDAGSPVDGIEETARTDAVSLTYTAGTDRYQYTWKTERSWAGTCRELIIRFRDGSEQRALFKLK
jgi:hypothetical protein